jgi:outer membrane immunogenic protein
MSGHLISPNSLQKMPKPASCFAVLVLLVAMAPGAIAQSTVPWDGLYLGADIGGANNNACSTATLKGATIDSATNTTFANCPSSGVVGGIQIGENFQIKRLIVGVGADVVVSGAKQSSSVLIFTGATPPPGTYSFSGKLSPRDFAIIGPRIGYAGDLLLPYLKGGVVIAAGAQNSTLNYTPTGTTKPIAAFSGGKNFNSVGWAAGGGTEIGLNGSWSISLEYLHMSLGRRADDTASCAGAAGACAAFTDISLESTHKSFTANIVRIGINYWFNYWDSP